MKRSLFISAIYTIFHFALIAQTPTAHFKFDNSLNEFYSNALLDSTNATFGFSTDEIGNTNSALEMTGGVFTMTDPTFMQFGLEDFSFSLWFKRTESLWPAEWIFQKGNADGSIRFRYNGFFDQMVFYFRPDIDSSELVVATANNSVGLDTWGLYTVTVDRDGDMKIYQNGQFVYAKDISNVSASPVNFFGGIFRLGCQDIEMNDLLFFDTALDSTEVQVLFNHELDIDNLLQEDFVVYPNPAINTLKLKSTRSIDEEYSLFSLEGKLIQKGWVENNQIEIGEISSGKYLLKIRNKSFSVVF